MMDLRTMSGFPKSFVQWCYVPSKIAQEVSQMGHCLRAYAQKSAHLAMLTCESSEPEPVIAPKVHHGADISHCGGPQYNAPGPPASKHQHWSLLSPPLPLLIRSSLYFMAPIPAKSQSLILPFGDVLLEILLV